MSTVAANDAKETLAELVKKSEAGHDAVIMNRGEPLARLGPPGVDHDVDRAVAVAERMLQTAKRIARNNITIDEIRAWTHEGRP